MLKTKPKFVKILIGLGIILAIVLGSYFFIGSVRHFEYKGVTFDVVQEGQLVLYKTSLPVIYEGVIVPYNFYLRNDPRKLKNIPFEANMTYLPYLVINMTQFGPSCYTINVDDCEILKVTEKLMVENFIEIERLKNLQED